MKWFEKWTAKQIKDPDMREKALATIAEEPWVKVVNVNFADPTNPGAGYFELDWNKFFIKQLVTSGYSGRSDQDIIDLWFNDVCRGVIGDNL